MRRYGFNLGWMFMPETQEPPQPVEEKVLDFMVAEGFDFARFPLHYHFWAAPGDYRLPDDATCQLIDGYVHGCHKRNIHASLNLHQAPGYSVSTARRSLEVHNLWTDEIAQDAFIRYWEFFAERYRDIPTTLLSYNLVNEPPAENVAGFTRQAHEALMRRTTEAIRAIDPEHTIVFDGIVYGTAPSPELADVPNTVQTVRGYQPFPLTHYGAEWEESFKNFTEPTWPGTFFGKYWDKEILREHYQPWRDLEAQGVPVHASEFGCYNKTPNTVALSWFADLLSLFREWNWGWAMWGFDGAFGIVEHERPGVVYEDLHGYRVDRSLLELVRPPR